MGLYMEAYTLYHEMREEVMLPATSKGRRFGDSTYRRMIHNISQPDDISETRMNHQFNKKLFSPEYAEKLVRQSKKQQITILPDIKQYIHLLLFTVKFTTNALQEQFSPNLLDIRSKAYERLGYWELAINDLDALRRVAPSSYWLSDSRIKQNEAKRYTTRSLIDLYLVEAEKIATGGVSPARLAGQ